MKVYFIGSHSVGKTTLARYVSEKYKLPMITEMARAVLSEKELNINSLRTNMEIVDDYQTQIFYRQLQEENQIKRFVSDRSFDCLSYAAQHSRIFSKLMKSSELQKYLDILRDSQSFIFFVRPSKATLKEDGIRESLTWDGVVSIDAMIKMLVQLFEIRYFSINTDNMQERVQLIDSVLSFAK